MEKEINQELANSLNKMGVTVNYNAYDHIELTDEEMKILIYNAKKAKAGRLAEKEYWSKVNQENKIETMGFAQTVNYYEKRAKEICPEFKIDKYNEKIFEQLCLYFSDFSSTKGILLCGPVGCGKTTLMNIFSINQKSTYQIISCRKVGFDYSENGVSVIDEYSSNLQTGTNKFGQRIIGKCFDDLGSESTAKHFGKEMNVMEEIFLSRYDKRNSYNSAITHCTTNLTINEIKEIYGDRVISRFKELFIMVSFDVNAKDLRK